MVTISACAKVDRVESTREASIWRLVSKRSNEIVAITPGGEGPPFYCIHSVAGDVTGYFELARLLGPEVTFYGIQVPKPDMVVRSVQSIECMADRYVLALTNFQPEGPLIIGGFSAGAIIALEVAQRLRALGRDVPLLVALDGAPGNTNAGMKPWAPKYLYHIALDAIQRFKHVRSEAASYRELVRRMLDRLLCRTHFKIPLFRSGRTLDVAAMLNVFARPGWQDEYKLFMRAMYAAMNAYTPVPYDGRVVVYELDFQAASYLRQIGAVWAHLASDCEVFRVSGRHGQFFVGETIAPMVTHLRQALKKARNHEKSTQELGVDPAQVVASTMCESARPVGVHLT